MDASQTKISDELSICVTKIKHEIADDLSAHGTKITNELDAKNNTTITAEIERILTDVYKKLTAEINTKISNELFTRLSEINTELNDKLTAEIKKINSYNAGYASEAQKLFNDMATRINNIKKACYNNFASVNASIEALQNGLIQHYAITRRNQPIEANQQSVSNHSEVSNQSHISSSGSSSGNEDFQIIEEHKISSQEFFELTKEELRDYGLKGGPATRTTKFFEELKNYKEVFEDCVKDKVSAVNSVPNTILRSQFEIIGDVSASRVDYTIKKIYLQLTGSGFEEIICVTEVKQIDIKVGVAQNLMQLEGSLDSNKNKKRKLDELYPDQVYSEYIYGIVSTGTDWYFLKHTSDQIFCSQASDYIPLSSSQYPVSPIRKESKSLEDKAIDEFL
ncbi:37563_t:CDS:2, partial [Gigaspora margarita]